MGKRSRVLSNQDRQQIRELGCQGYRPAEIADMLGLPGRNVSGCYSRLRNAGLIPPGTARLSPAQPGTGLTGHPSQAGGILETVRAVRSLYELSESIVQRKARKPAPTVGECVKAIKTGIELVRGKRNQAPASTPAPRQSQQRSAQTWLSERARKAVEDAAKERERIHQERTTQNQKDHEKAMRRIEEDHQREVKRIKEQRKRDKEYQAERDRQRAEENARREEQRKLQKEQLNAAVAKSEETFRHVSETILGTGPTEPDFYEDYPAVPEEGDLVLNEAGEVIGYVTGEQPEAGEIDSQYYDDGISYGPAYEDWDYDW